MSIKQTVDRRGFLAASAGLATLPLIGGIRPAHAQAPKLKIGCLTDMSGPYKDLAGPVAIAAVRQAIEDFGVSGKGMEVEVLSADHQNKADVGASVARQWYDRDGVDLIVEVANSSVALAVAGVAKEKNKVYINCGAATSDLTGPACNANTIHWTYDTFMLAKSTGGAMVGAGGDTWFFITADYAFGHALQRDTTDFIQQAGGKVLGSIAYAFPGTTDFSSALIQAQASGAKVLGLANAGTDTINTIKQAQEFGIKMRIGGLLLFITDVHSLGLDVAKGIVLTDSFYWDLNDRTRAFSNRLAPKAPGVRPSMVQAGTYSSTLHYLKVATDMGVAQIKADGAATVARLKARPTDDDCFGAGMIRADGRKIHPSYLWEVKKPSESKGPWDYYKLLATTPADQAFRPLDKGGCPLVKT
jgi:branched-chain amino acid transport system substrate-binding protein